MVSTCVLCGYQGEVNSIIKQPDLRICLSCYVRFYAEKDVAKEKEDEMGWNDVSGTSGGKDPDVLTITPNTTKLMHVLLPDTEEPVSYWTHYIPNKVPNGPKGAVVICPGKDVCPACNANIYRTKRVHAINVWDYETKSVKILEGGNSIFQALKQIKEQIGTLLSVDISIKKIGSGIDTEYSVIPIPMMQPFDGSNIRGLFPIASLRLPDSVAVVGRYMDAMGGVTPEPTTAKTGAPATTQQIITDMKTTPTEPVLQFGKYKGRTVEDVYSEDANYIKWCAENISDPTIKAEAKRIIEAKNAPLRPGIVSESTVKQVLINEINEIFQLDERYKNNFQLILQKMRDASISLTHPNGKTILTEYTVDELNKLVVLIK